MVFASVLFLLVFFPLFLIAYHIAPHHKRNIVALVASLMFYMWGAPGFFWLLIALLVINFYCVRKMDGSTSKAGRKRLLTTSLLINLGTLAYFKYANFFVDNINAVIKGVGLEPMPWLEVALPIGISFFTFQSITYTLDVYWQRHRSLDKISDYLLYILLFPQLIAGPIIRFNTIADEIKDRRHNYTFDHKLSGWYIFVIGLAKKVLIANEVGEQVDLIFGQENELSVQMSWIGIIAYSIQIYFDFSGYSDMAIGIGRIMGFNFPENFNNPYTSRSITEFWRRWHITLGTFMRDYLYIPLGGNRTTVYRNYLNLIIVFLLSGLWHGASWSFVVWGAWHGVFLIIERAFLLKILKKTPYFLSMIYSYFVVLIGWVFFRADDLPRAATYLKNMFGVNAGGLSGMSLPGTDFFTFLAIGILFSFLTMWPTAKKAEQFLFDRIQYNRLQHTGLFVLSLAFFIISLGYISASGFNPFIYFRF